jgi:predicted lipoprotein with Yx(FWY)xxD motif
MNKGMAIGAVIVLLIIIAGGAYVLTMNKGAASYTSTVAASTSVPYSNVTTTVAASGTVTTSVLPSNIVVPSNSSNGTYAVEFATSNTYGTYLTNSTGYTLYIDTSDVANSGTSSCTASCANVWPPFYPANLTIQPGFNATWFGIINRTGGKSMQVTYKGQPLYFYNGDSKPGAITGNGAGTFVVANK